ncbi:xanthine dehydrogenase family protein molybdopterin-binding subunit [Umezawaea endophytica]|uniref:Molybdopterin-dependent oxidoreductase n=3 Tax=Umezawaea endophytica TaxID=1654476 RepID=A0A9X2ZZG9_9PSEU|nr:molybdopterin cofactor-binding domain-containing protein [Umezawaea endophytica]MCS7477374.1 molybdopterin-dependent oxidoreductase [Umezawaea endophytica]
MLGRRSFLTAAGLGALVVALPVPALADAEGLVPNVFVRLDADGRITATAPRPDSGQGVRTVVAMLVAEELAVDLDAVRVEQALGDPVRYGSQAVGNSVTLRQTTEPLRRAAATARCLLVAAAADRWGVPREDCRARNGFVTHPRHRRLPYAALVADAAALDPTTVAVTLTPQAEWRVLGREAGRIDAHDIVTGKARYGIDVARPGLLTAVVARPPWIGAVPDVVDDSAARAVAGVADVVRVAAGIAVVAGSAPAALRGRAALRVTWTGGTPTADSRVWLEDLAAALPATGPAPGPVALEAEYRLPLLAHAPMEPMNATADVRPDSASLWVPTQDPGRLRTLLAQTLGLDPAMIRVEPTLAGGAFGRRIETDYVLEAVACSRAVGAPVKVLWTRDDDTRHDSYRPMSVHRLSAVVDAEGLPTWRSHAVSTWPLTTAPPFANPAVVKGSGDHFPYTVPGAVTVGLTPAPLRTAYWRAVYAGQFGYAEECFLSALGDRGGWDQVALRRRLLPPESRLRRVLDVAANRARWSASRKRARGVACHLDYGSAIAVIAVVELEDGVPRVRKVTAAVDVGPALHPSGVRAQVEGCVMDAVSTVLGARITVRDGQVVQSSFRDYPWARIDRAPDVDVVLVPSDAPIGGLGELAYPPAAAAIASAVAVATGRPVTGMPVNTDVG